MGLNHFLNSKKWYEYEAENSRIFGSSGKKKQKKQMVETRPVHGCGLGLFSKAAVSSGGPLFTEVPAYTMQNTGNRRLVTACAFCHRYVGSVNTQIETIFQEDRFVHVAAELASHARDWSKIAGNYDSEVVRCTQGCGEVYCSTRCRADQFEHSHNFLCVGQLQENAPLMEFKYHALEYYETMLLAATIFANLINRTRAGMDMRSMMQELLGFTQQPLEHACRAPPGRPKDDEFMEHTQKVVETGFTLLRDHFNSLDLPLTARELFTSSEFFSRILGMFELNNVDIEISHPLQGVFQHLAATAYTNADHEALTTLLREKAVVMRCVWGKDTTGILDSDSEAYESEDDDNMEHDHHNHHHDHDHDHEMQIDDNIEEIRKEVSKLDLIELSNLAWPAFHGTAFSQLVSRCNHACDPNGKVEYLAGSRELTCQAQRDVPENTEIRISYIDQFRPLQYRQRKLREYGFDCECAKCQQEAANVLSQGG
eukprot:GEMP01018570.1.p1 GENE.GEMP01018570.1~~GEMP01018570.1.p1  ORF type:complete len:483 (-),score=102.09 GEMP01018570.1:1094-2542(-)